MIDKVEDAAAAQEHIKLDYTLEDPAARVELVNKIVDSTSPDQLSPKYLTILADYILAATTRKERRKHFILNDNIMATVNKRETSYEGLVEKFENGEDGVYNLITNDKNMILTPKIGITKKDLDNIPELRQLRDAIADIERQIEAASGRKRFHLKKTLIEMRKEQYILKNAFNKPIYFLNVRKSFHQINLDEEVTVKEDQTLDVKGTVSLLNPTHVSLLLCNYDKIKMDNWDRVNSDIYYLILDLEDLIDKTLINYPIYYDLLIYKIDKMTNEEIQKVLNHDYSIKYSVEYISSLWRNKIPKILAEQAQKQYLTWYYTNNEQGQWKKCSRCGEIKLAHPKFFSVNKDSKDGFYSICKDCRNKQYQSQKKFMGKTP